MGKHIVHTTIRFNLDRSEDAAAWRHLGELQEQGVSYSKSIIAALNNTANEQVTEAVYQAIRQGVKEAIPLILAKELFAALGNNAVPMPPTVSIKTESQADEEPEIEEAALDFLDNY